MSKLNIVRKAFRKTIYELECNHNLVLDYPKGRTTKKPLKQQTIIKRHFSDALNLSLKLGSKLFAEYSVKNIDLRDNSGEFFRLISSDKELFNVNIKARTFEVFGATQPIFIY